MSSKTTRFENLLEAVPDALVGMDQKGVIRFVNRQTESLFGYDRDELIGQPIEMLVPESLWQIYAEHREDYFADPRTRSSGLDLELSGRQRDGTEFPINISLSHIDTGDVLLVITAVRDVTQQEAGGQERPAHRGDRRVLGRCHHRQHARGHHHELEPGRREDVRLLEQGDHRQVRQPPDSPKIEPVR